QNDRILVVVAFPWHKRHEQVTTQRHFAIVGTWAIGKHLACLNTVAHVDQRSLVVVRALVGALKLAQHVGITNTFIIHDGDEVSVDVFNNAGLRGDDHIAGIVCSAQLHTGTNIRCFAANQWNSLLLHVRTHQGTVSIVMLQERNHGRTNRNHLTWRHVNVVDAISVGHADIAVLEVKIDTVADDVSDNFMLKLSIQDVVIENIISSQATNLVDNPSLFNHTERTLDETESNHARTRRKGTDKT